MDNRLKQLFAKRDRIAAKLNDENLNEIERSEIGVELAKATRLIAEHKAIYIWQEGKDRILRKEHPKKEGSMAFFHERKKFGKWRTIKFSFVNFLDDDLENAIWYFGLL